MALALGAATLVHWPLSTLAEGTKPASRKLLWEGAVPSKPASAIQPLRQARRALVPFATAPFPYDGANPKTGEPFLDLVADGRHGRRLPRTGEIRWQDDTYSDARVLLFLPSGFNAARPALIVLFLHGNGATLERDVEARQQVTAQISQSGLNAALIAPQLAVDAPDSSPGKFWQPDAFARFLSEAQRHLTALHGNRRSRVLFSRAPVLIVAYSGGYLPAAYVLHHGGAADRILGVALLDGLYAEQETFAAWIEAHHQRTFFVSAYGPSAAPGHGPLASLLATRGMTPSPALPRTLRPGSLSFFDAGPSADHAHFVTAAWRPQPLADLLARIPGFPRAKAR